MEKRSKISNRITAKKPAQSKQASKLPKGKKQIPPKIAQMPCHRVKYSKLQEKKARQLKTLALHKNLVVNILLYATANVKDILNFRSVCRRFKECTDLPIVWFYFYQGQGWSIDSLFEPEEAEHLKSFTHPDQQWEYMRDENSKVDWEEQARTKFALVQSKKDSRVAKGFSRFFETDIKKLRKDMRKYLQTFKFNFRIQYNSGQGTCVIPASKVLYFEHSLCATYHPKKLMNIQKLADLEVVAVSKAKDLKRTITKKLEITPESLMHTCIPEAPEIMIGLYDESQIAFITLSYSYTDFFLKMLDKVRPSQKRPGDIDPGYEFNNYNFRIELRNNKERFWYEIFGGVFTRQTSENGYSVFNLIKSTDNQRHFNFNGRIEYPCESMIATTEFNDLCYVDVSILDESNNPFFDTSRACRIVKQSDESVLGREFSNEVDYNYQEGEISWIRSELDNEIAFRIQLQYIEEEDKTYITDLEVSAKLSNGPSAFMNEIRASTKASNSKKAGMKKSR
ncbi:unnamed protein product [Moneuplotes crassus]|uniref:F-box domain-containing protein n=1 Tax=Euplotes crassus TaxID=5936 RepID=A0AAD1UBP7_EUPCR|nr:unnamed protein product [Moneuplotes crassus]